MRQRGGGGITAKRDMCLASGKGGLQQAEERWNSYGQEQHNHRGGSGVRRSEQHRKGWHQNFDSNTLFHQKVGEEERAAKRKCDGHRFGATGGHEGHTRTRVGRSGGDFVWERRQDDSGGVHSGGHQRRRGTSRAGAQDILPGLCSRARHGQRVPPPPPLGRLQRSSTRNSHVRNRQLRNRQLEAWPVRKGVPSYPAAVSG